MASQVELTPCGAMFDIFKRAAHLSHTELCGLVLSSRPLADGRSPQSRAADRSAQSHGLHGCDQYGVRSCR